MNNTEQRCVAGCKTYTGGEVKHHKDCPFYHDSISESIDKLLTAAKVSSIDEVVSLLERKRDPQGFLINTDIDDTMCKPLSDEELTKLASDMFDSGDIDNTTSFKLGYKAAANRPQAGWIDVKDRLPEEECKSVLVYAPRSFPKNSRCVVAEYKDDVKGFYSESDEIFMEDVTHWCELPNEPLPPKPKQ